MSNGTKHDPVNHPAHYTSHPSGVECIQVTEHMSFNLGNAFKYVFRHESKGKPIEDLNKAIWYIDREVERKESEFWGALVALKSGYMTFHRAGIAVLIDAVTEAEPNKNIAGALELIAFAKWSRSALGDLKKAHWYLEREISFRKRFVEHTAVAGND